MFLSSKEPLREEKIINESLKNRALTPEVLSSILGVASVYIHSAYLTSCLERNNSTRWPEILQEDSNIMLPLS